MGFGSGCAARAAKATLPGHLHGWHREQDHQSPVSVLPPLQRPARPSLLHPAAKSALPAQVHAARAKGRPYTIVFVGVNGVGKSTSLSKVAYWLLQNDIKARPGPQIQKGVGRSTHTTVVQSLCLPAAGLVIHHPHPGMMHRPGRLPSWHVVGDTRVLPRSCSRPATRCALAL